MRRLATRLQRLQTTVYQMTEAFSLPCRSRALWDTPMRNTQLNTLKRCEIIKASKEEAREDPRWRTGPFRMEGNRAGVQLPRRRGAEVCKHPGRERARGHRRRRYRARKGGLRLRGVGRASFRFLMYIYLSGGQRGCRGPWEDAAPRAWGSSDVFCCTCGEEQDVSEQIWWRCRQTA
jgi:hypothetical protein